MTAIVGMRTRRRWAAPLAGCTGLVVSVGFVAYHAMPVHSPVTNPYLGEGVGAPAWVSVAAAVIAGAWTASLAMPRAAALNSDVNRTAPICDA